jgi:hypothetical protein
MNLRPFTVEERETEEAYVKEEAEFLGLQDDIMCERKFSGFCSCKKQSES